MSCMCGVWGVMLVRIGGLDVCRSGLMGVVEKVRFGDLHPSTVFVLTWRVCVFLFFSKFVFFVCIMLGLAGQFRIL